MKGVVVLYNSSDRLVKGEARDLLADRGVIACAEAVGQALDAAGYSVALVPMHHDVESTLEPYPPSQWDVFNLGEGLEGRLFEEARIAWALEAMGYTFTGSDGEAIARGIHKARTKMHLSAARVTTPRWWLLRAPSEVAELVGEFEFPLIVKPVAEDASAGIGPDAVVHSILELEERVEYVVRCYRQAALVEAFIDGREFNIALWGDPPEVLPLAELDFSAFDDPYARIVSFAAKWEEDSFEYNNTPVVCPARVDALLAERIASTAEFAWEALGCRGYARVDMRVNGDGVPQVVEVNCNPDLSPDAGFYRAAQTAGYSYADMVTYILEIARRQPYVLDRVGLRERWPVYTRDQWERRGL
jgi:D-alanine-D-alanine ligase